METIEDFEIEDLGVQEEWVYDIEVEDNHNFFGNNILVHNSVYFHIEPFMNMFQTKNPGLTMDEYVDWADAFEKKVIQPVINNTIAEFAEELNAYNTETIGAEREIISDCIAPQTQLKILENGKVRYVSVRNLAKEHGVEPMFHKPALVDVSNANIMIPSVNKNGKRELKRIINIQKKVTAKDYIELTAPTGSKIKVTEDHPIAVNVDGEITYKEAQHITVEDDVVLFDVNRYNKTNCELFNQQYENHGSKYSDAVTRGAHISEVRTKQSKIRADAKNKQFSKRINDLLYRRSGKWDKIIRRMSMCGVGRKNSHQTVLEYVRSLKLPFDDNVVVMLTRYAHSDTKRAQVREYKDKKRFGATYYYKLAVRMRAGNKGFVKLQRRIGVLDRKASRREKSTPLHTAKHAYRIDVNRETKKSLRNQEIPNLHLRDKYNYNLDHIVPVMCGFRHKIPPAIIGNIKNLRVIPKIQNIKKRMNIDYDCVDKLLFKDYL